jgi:trehalose 6-phosphate synthase/phosphatase
MNDDDDSELAVISVDKLRAEILKLEQQQHKEIGIKPTGRVIHVCHLLPITATLSTDSPSSGVLSPPPTPPPGHTTPPQITVSSSNSPQWSLGPRYGHAAMVSGIRSLSATHDQVIVGWTGDILSPIQDERVPSESISDEDKKALDVALGNYVPGDAGPGEDDSRISYVPVWLDGKVAHGHYDGYCKTS